MVYWFIGYTMQSWFDPGFGENLKISRRSKACDPSVHIEIASKWMSIPQIHRKYALVIWHSYWKLSFIVDLPIKNCDFP
jgi:hypothetical protein